ncbi:MAG: class I mannose-6-phosphate isomerase [Bacteroidales bacterium]|nr:class I mannose-6-phosphate isomerase [Bacteroidales bacterium]
MKKKVWGGTNIKDILKIDIEPLENCGELWVLSGIEGEETLVENGFLKEASLKEIISMYSDELLGEENFEKFYDDFPLLLKIIDAEKNLSIQVHPDDNYAEAHGYANGKNEMWYIMHSNQGSVSCGWNKKVTKAQVINSIRDKNLPDLLLTEPVREDDAFFVAAGTIHAINSGVMLAEIQQSSDLTYRIYDYDRTDAEGNKRELHLQQAIDVLDLSYAGDTAKIHYHNHLNHTHNIIDTPFFSTNIINLDMQAGLRKDYSALDSFVIYFCVGGKAQIQALNTTLTIQAGQTILLPAITKEAIIVPTPQVKILECTILD